MNPQEESDIDLPYELIDEMYSHLDPLTRVMFILSGIEGGCREREIVKYIKNVEKEGTLEGIDCTRPPYKIINDIAVECKMFASDSLSVKTKRIYSDLLLGDQLMLRAWHDGSIEIIQYLFRNNFPIPSNEMYYLKALSCITSRSLNFFDQRVQWFREERFGRRFNDPLYTTPKEFRLNTYCAMLDIPLDTICWFYTYLTDKQLPTSENDDFDDIIDSPHFTKKQLDQELEEYMSGYK
jgi:hypothetical protein